MCTNYNYHYSFYYIYTELLVLKTPSASIGFIEFLLNLSPDHLGFYGKDICIRCERLFVVVWPYSVCDMVNRNVLFVLNHNSFIHNGADHAFYV